MIVRIAATCALLLLCGCTRFAFKDTGKGTAPDEIVSRDHMVSFDGGTFQMGAVSAEPDEFPVHKVTVKAFRLDKNEVTVGDYQQCVDRGVCAAPSLTVPGATELHPVVGVNWAGAQRYCGWAGKRLPTEAEWEYGARFPLFGPFPWEGKLEPGRLNERGDADGHARTAPVGSFASGHSPRGVHDMAGNVAEWTADWYEANYYTKSPPSDPKGPATDTGTRVVRGGSWSTNAFRARSTARFGQDPNVSNDAVGFRCAAD
jgi:formylglycine-generating enzyme